MRGCCKIYFLCLERAVISLFSALLLKTDIGSKPGVFLYSLYVTGFVYRIFCEKHYFQCQNIGVSKKCKAEPLFVIAVHHISASLLYWLCLHRICPAPTEETLFSLASCSFKKVAAKRGICRCVWGAKLLEQVLSLFPKGKTNARGKVTSLLFCQPHSMSQPSRCTR